MIKLRTRGTTAEIRHTLVGAVGQRNEVSGDVLLVGPEREGSQPQELARLTTRDSVPAASEGTVPVVYDVESLIHLSTGDVVAVDPSGSITTLFRSTSTSNSLFVTEQCNSRCLMCSQPPRQLDDIDHFLALNARLIEFLPAGLDVLGITGGEPTLLRDKLLRLIGLIRSQLPNTKVEILSNGRLFADEHFARQMAEVAGDVVLFSVPLYADFASRHDYIVQASGAFVQTVHGLYNLASHGVRAEIRIVLHRLSVPRLVPLSQFIQKNLPFVEHVAFMGLEHVGYARANEELLWIDPTEYASELASGIDHLTTFGIPASIYNLPLCLLAAEIRRYARVSISDWKREYPPICSTCLRRSECGGVFGTSKRQSSRLLPFTDSVAFGT